MNKTACGNLAAAVFLVLSIPLVAHHGGASFDNEKTLTFKGTVAEWLWANPHCFLKVDVKDDSGTVRLWNLEYRRAGNGGGWPHTFSDVLAGIDKLGDIAGEHGLRLDRVVALGHSAGGHLAVWAAGRSRLGQLGAPDADRQLLRKVDDGAVHLTGVVSQSGVLNLAEAERLNLSNGAVSNLLGGSSEKYPKRHKYADPMSAVPLKVPVYAVHGTDDDTVPVSQSDSYAAAAKSAGAPVQLLKVPGDHFALIDPKTAAYRKCRELVQLLLG